jgi:hypothetical protein
LQDENSEISVELSLDIAQDVVSCEELDLIQAHFAGLLSSILMETDSLDI